jgi:hypothetical protein
LGCNENSLIELDLTVLDKLTAFYGSSQQPQLTLYKNEANTYSLPISLNNPTFGNNKISYKNGILTSTDNTVDQTSFIVQTNKTDYTLSGVISFIYANVGIDTIDNELLSVYPNPTTGELRITNYELRIKGVEVFDVSGRMQKAESRMQNVEEERVLDISHLPTGIYFVKVTTEQGEIVKKIVKQ